ncbi:MAG TPA: hypothetical protein VKE94_23620 [Gemmataceae bacterium]|nr:hypothetical protein [Gemmataceae bacterium]
MAGLGLVAGRSVGRAQFSGFKTDPESLDIGGYEFAVGASINIFVDRWICNA